MQYRTLGRTGLRVSLLSYGTGGPSNFGRRKGLTSSHQDALVRRCFDLGINFFDTAAAYHQSEEDLGRALEGIPRDSYILATKFSQHDASTGRLKDDPEELAQSVEMSLQRLRTDYVDVMQFHGLAPNQYDEVIGRFYPVMERLRDEGKVRFTGFSEYLRSDAEHEAITRALKEHPGLWDTVMLKYGILYQWAEEGALPLAERNQIGVLNMAPVRLSLSQKDELQQLLAQWRADGLISDGELPGGDSLDWLVHDSVPSVVSAAYKFAAMPPAISTVLTGTSSIEHLEENAAALEEPWLPEEDVARIKRAFGGRVLPFTV